LKKLHSQRKKEKEKEIKKKRGGEEEKKDQEQQQHEEEKCARAEWKRGGRGGGPWRPFGVVFLKQEGEKGTGVGVELIMDPGDRWGDLRWVKRKKKPR